MKNLNNIQVTATTSAPHSGTASACNYPKAFQVCGACPRCGAPIFIDAVYERNEHGDFKTLPTPYFTCMCRLSSQQQTIYVGPVLGKPESYPPAYPEPFWKWCPSTVTCQSPGAVNDGAASAVGVHPNMGRTGIDWSKFTGSGGCSGFHDPNMICLN